MDGDDDNDDDEEGESANELATLSASLENIEYGFLRPAFTCDTKKGIGSICAMVPSREQ